MKTVVIDRVADKEIQKFPRSVIIEIYSLLSILEETGKLEPPEAKKISKDIFEIRIRSGGQWRVLYAYIQNNNVIILSAFVKKSQKTPKNEIRKAQQRLLMHNM